MRHSVPLALLGLVTVLCSCSPVEKSAESEFLQKSVAPQIGQWAAGPEATFSLATISLDRGYDAFCLAPEYYPLSSVEKHVSTPIVDYHSNFGRHIPEMRMALVALRGGSAHAALLNVSDIEFRQVDFEHPPKCVDARRAAFEKSGKLVRLTTL